MISKHGVKIHSVWKCRKCGKVQYYHGSGQKPQKCYIRKCGGEMRRKA